MREELRESSDSPKENLSLAEDEVTAESEEEESEPVTDTGPKTDRSAPGPPESA